MIGALRLGLPTRDRRVLEDLLLPYFAARPDVDHVLFVGCGWYTRSYAKMFEGKDYVTLDVDPAKRRHGAARHVCDSLARLEAHFPADSLDLVVCNGVFGWGLDERTEVEAAFAACRACLRSGGMLVLGWNDIPARRPFPLGECEALKRFARYTLPPLGKATLETGTRNRHVFDFYVK